MKSKLKDMQSSFVFTDDKMQVITTGNNTSSSSEISYASLLKVLETNDAFYIYFNINQAFLISKKAIDANILNNLRELLKSKLPSDKYIISK